MRSVVNVLAILIYTYSSPFCWGIVPEEPAETRALYRRAADAIQQRDLGTAEKLLEQLTQQSPDSPLAEIAAFHLAECYLLTSQFELALEQLHRWGGRIDNSATVEQLSPATKSKTRELFKRVVSSVPDDPTGLGILERHGGQTAIEAMADNFDWFSSHLLLELSRRYQRQQQFEMAERCLQRLVEAGVEPVAELRIRLEVELPLVWAEHSITHGQPELAIRVLQTALATAPNAEQELSLRFLLAEAFFAAGDRGAAADQFQWLADQAESANTKPAWQAAVALRRADLLVRSRQFNEARQLLQQSQQRHASFESAYEFDYLLARCALARIEFDEAVRLLERVIAAPAAAGKEASARAGWMLGEIYFLQRQYAQAIVAYQNVARLTGFPDWQARALLQSAKCHELLGNSNAALTDYQRATQFSQQPEILRTVTERTAVIQNATRNLR